MRFVRLVASVYLSISLAFGLVPGSGSQAHADVLGRMIAFADGPADAGGASPQQSSDLIAWAGEPKAITLPDLLQIAVRQAPSLAAATIDIAIAEARIEQTWGRNDWQLKVVAQGSRAAEPFISQIGILVDTNTRIGGTADVSRLLPTGGSIAFHVDTTYNNDEVEGMNATIWTSDISGSIVQPLLRGRGRALFEANEARAQLAHDTNVLARRVAAIQTIQTVIAAYWDLVLAEQTVAITQQSLDLARERLRVTQIGADGGKVARSEIPAVLQIIATRQEDVLNGELSVLNSSIALRRAAGMAIGQGELGLRVSTELGAQERPLDLGALVDRAYAASPELAQIAKQDASAAIDIEVADNGLLPQLDASLSIGPNGNGGSFSEAAKQTVEFQGLTVQGQLTFSQALGRSEARGRLHEQRELKHKLVINQLDMRAQLAQTMARAVAQVELARRRVTLSQQAIELANENIKIETDRFNLGKSTNFDVLNRLEELRQAELRKAQALIDWHKGEIVVDSLTGDILPKYGIAIDK